MVGTFVSRAFAALSTASPRFDPTDLVRAVGFWIAVAFPLVYLTLALIDLRQTTHVAFAGAIALNVLALVAGHGYEPSRFGR